MKRPLLKNLSVNLSLGPNSEYLIQDNHNGEDYVHGGCNPQSYLNKGAGTNFLWQEFYVHVQQHGAIDRHRETSQDRPHEKEDEGLCRNENEGTAGKNEQDKESNRI